MGRIFEKRKDRMFARWSKMARAFTKVGREIAIAVKLGGQDPDTNPRLRAAIQVARGLNMPKDRIDAAVNRAASKDEASLSEVVYEGYAPHGVAVIVEAATNNATRTIANVRSIFVHHEGSMATSGALSFLFQRRGVFAIPPISGDVDEFELEMIDAGLEDIFETEQGFLLYSSFENFVSLQAALEKRKVEIKSATLQRLPLSTVEVSAAHQKAIEEFIEEMEEDDDVQHVYHNMQIE